MEISARRRIYIRQGRKVKTLTDKRAERFGGKKKLEVTSQKTGKKKVIKTKKNPPKGCSRPRQICIVCMTTRIHKNDSNYSLKICKCCERGSARAQRSEAEINKK